MKFSAYAGASLLMAVITVLHAWQTRVEYYPTVRFLTTNKLAQAVLGNWAIVMTIGFGKLMSKLFLGPLRDIEVEVMYENARYAFTETCLALTVFRGDLTAVTIALFVQLLLIKAFHWLSRARVEHLEQAGAQSLTSMTRLCSLVIVTLSVDGFMVTYCLENISVDRASAFVLFAFEYAILSIAAFSTAVHLFLHVVDSRMEGAWHGKATWTMLLEFFSEVFKFSFYLIFFAVMFTLYGVPPLNLIRDIYMSFGQLQRRLQAFYRYRQLANTMDERFPAATEEELEGCEHTCIICRDAMDAGKKLPCSHIFHFQCLRLWLQQQQACPTCRANIPTHNTAAERAAAAAAAAAATVQQGAAAEAVPAVAGEAPAAAAVVVAEPGAAAAAAAVEPGAAAMAAAGEPVPVPAAAAAGAAALPAAPRIPAGAGTFGAGPVDAVHAVDGGNRAPLSETPRAAGGMATPSVGEGGGGGGGGGGGDYGAGVRGVAMAGLDAFGAGGVGGGGLAAPAPGFAGLLRSGGGGAEGCGPAEAVLQTVIVVSPTGATVRKDIRQDSPALHTEPADSVLLLMAAPSPCGSFLVCGGWVGGPGLEGDVRLVEIAPPAVSEGNASTPPPSGIDEVLDGPRARQGTGAGRDGLRQRRVVPAGADH